MNIHNSHTFRFALGTVAVSGRPSPIPDAAISFSRLHCDSNRTALMFARDLATVRVLLDAGADPNAVEENGRHTWDFHEGEAAALLKEKAGVE